MKKKNSWSSLAFAIGIALTIRWGVAEAYVIPSGSMIPTLLINDHIFVNKIIHGIRVPFTNTWIKSFAPLQRGEVVVFRDPRNESINLIKRVIGLPGDKIFYEKGKLYINDQLVEEGPEKLNHKIVGDNLDQVKDEDLENERADHVQSRENLNGHVHSVLNRSDHGDLSVSTTIVPPESFFVLGDHRDNSADSRYWGFAPMKNILGKAEFVWLSCENAIPYIKVGCDPTSIRWHRFLHRII